MAFIVLIPGVDVERGWWVVEIDPLVTGYLCIWCRCDPLWLMEWPTTDPGLQILEFSISSSKISSGLLPALLDNFTRIRLCLFRWILWNVWRKYCTLLSIIASYYKGINQFHNRVCEAEELLTSHRERGATSSPDPGELWLILLRHPGDPGMIPWWPCWPPIGDFIVYIHDVNIINKNVPLLIIYSFCYK